jgi:type IV pilus assembly protein PilW
MKSSGRFSRTSISRLSAAADQAGLTLVELMVSITLGMLTVLIATALLVSSKSGYLTQDDATRLQETARYALESLARAVRQTAYENWDKEEAPLVADAAISANIVGLDAHRLKDKAGGIESPMPKSINGSDVLAVRFFGIGSGANGDGTMINCAGFGVPAPESQHTVEEDRGWSIFYVAESSGEPELRCKYQGKGGWSSDAIARGVESFQILYGVDTDADGLSNQYVTATAIHAMDDALHLVGSDSAAKAIDKNRKTNWKKVVAVKIALLVRGSQSVRVDALTTQYDLFGKDYSDAYGAIDIGTQIKETDLPATVRNRLRKTFTLTIQLRNQTAVSQV